MEKLAPTDLTAVQQEAAFLIAQDRLTNKKIAEQLNIGLRTLDEWKRQEGFQEAVKQHRRAFFEALRKEGIASGLARLRRQNDFWRRTIAVVTARAKDPTMQDVPGGKTGMIVRDYKVHKELGFMPVYSYDTGLAAAMNALEQHSQTDRGEWKEIVEQQVKPVSPLAAMLAKVCSPEELQDLKTRIEKASSEEEK